MIDGDKQESGNAGLSGKVGRFHRDVKERVLAYLTAAFGLVAGLAWNDAITALIEHLFPLQRGNVAAKFVYAIVVTLAVVVVTVYLVRWLKKRDTEEEVGEPPK